MVEYLTKFHFPPYKSRSINVVQLQYLYKGFLLILEGKLSSLFSPEIILANNERGPINIGLL